MKNSKGTNSVNITYMSIPEYVFMEKANEQLQNIDTKIKELNDERHELLNLIHIAKTYYKYKDEKPHQPTPEELDDFYELKGNK
jgi:hypothetical protein